MFKWSYVLCVLIHTCHLCEALELLKLTQAPAVLGHGLEGGEESAETEVRAEVCHHHQAIQHGALHVRDLDGQ